MATRAPIDQIFATPPRYGLLAAVPILDSSVRWQNGIVFQPDSCSGGGGVVSVGCRGNTTAITPDTRVPLVDADSFVVWASDTCSTLAFGAEDYEGRARRALAASESYWIAHELWSGTLAQSDALSNNWLTSIGSDVLTAGAVAPVQALACLEQGLAQCGKGRRGLIHMTPQLLTHLASGWAVRFEGGYWLTAMGNIVVADAGYGGTQPDNDAVDASSTWMYATSMMRVLLSPPEVFAPFGASSVDRSVNTVTVYAQRLALIQWDECCHLAAQTNVAVCAFGGVS